MTFPHHQFKTSALVLGIVAMALTPLPYANAMNGDFSIQTGQGEAFQVKHNLLGQRNFAVQDRLGDKISKNKDFLGNSKTDVSVLGNDFQGKKNIFGNKSVKASDMLGDKIETKRSWFGLGRRKTSINLSGSAGLFSRALAKKKPLANFNSAANQGQIDSAFPDLNSDPALSPTTSSPTAPRTGIPGVDKGAE